MPTYIPSLKTCFELLHHVWEHHARLGLEEGVRENDFVGFLQVGILQEFGINVEEDGHINLLVWIESLLFKAEALNLIEVLKEDMPTM